MEEAGENLEKWWTTWSYILGEIWRRLYPGALPKDLYES